MASAPPNRHVNQFGLAALAHEMRGRAASLATFSGELVVDARRHDTSWLDERLARISRTASEMHRIIDAVQRLEDRSLPERAPIDLSSLSARVLHGLLERTPSFARAMVRVQSRIHIVGDAAEIEVVLENLIGNALKFSAMRPKPEVRVTATSDGTGVLVQVSDNGVGIAPEDANRMFEPFTRCHSGFPGAGVGLAVVRRIVDRHHGRIWATGEPGLGTTVTFCM